MALNIGERTFDERMYDLLEVTEYRRMVSGEDREAAFRLRYQAYRREGFIDETHDGLSTDYLDEQPNTNIFGVYIAGELAGSIRISVVTSQCPHCSSFNTNPEVIEPKLEKGQVLIDPSRFIADPRLGREFPELPYLTIRIPSMASEHYLADECLSLVRKEHQAFYRRVFRSKPVAGISRYSGVNFDTQLMSTTVDVIRDDVARRYPFFQSTYLERRALFGPSSLMPGIEDGRTKVAA